MIEWLSSERNLKFALKILALVIAFLAMASYFGYLAVTQTDPKPCAPTEFPGRCYHVPQDACEIMWKHVDEGCRDFVKSLKMAPGQLTGPILSKCRLAQFDKANAFSRKSNDSCNNLYQELDEWRRRNLDSH